MAMAMAEMYNTGDADKNEKLVKAEFIRVTISISQTTVFRQRYHCHSEWRLSYSILLNLAVNINLNEFPPYI